MGEGSSDLFHLPKFQGGGSNICYPGGGGGGASNFLPREWSDRTCDLY